MQDNNRSSKEALIRQALVERIFTTVNVGTITLKTIPPHILDDVISPENLKHYFFKAFTHESYDYGESYETLETIGDLIANLLVGNKIIELYPDLNPKELSNMLAHYKSNKIFGDAINKAIPHLDTLIFISDVKLLNTKIYADVFEALICAVYRATNSVLPGIGFACAENVYKLLTRDFQFDRKYAEGNPKSVVFEIFGAENISEYPPAKSDAIFHPGDSITVTVHQAGIAWVNNIMDPRVKTITANTLTASGSGVDRATARTNAYNELLKQLLDKHKITLDRYQTKKREDILKSFSGVIDKKKVGYVDLKKKMDDQKEDLFFEKKKSSKKGMLDWKLIAQNKTDLKKRLVSTDTVNKGANGFEAAKQGLLEQYLAERR